MTAQCIYSPVGEREEYSFDRMMDVCLTISRSSNFYDYKIGAVIVKRKSVISCGFNSRKTHPLMVKYNPPEIVKKPVLHAEIHAISLARVSDLIGSTMYIGRLTKTGLLGNSRACIACYTAMKDYGVESMVYVEQGKLYREYIQ
jgi:tRNA(Arg) A34 adenosine deaminase TadA